MNNIILFICFKTKNHLNPVNSKKNSNLKQTKSINVTTQAGGESSTSESRMVNSSFSLTKKERDVFRLFREDCRKRISVNGSELIRILIKQIIEERDFEKIKSSVERIERFSVGRKRIGSSTSDYSEITDEQWKKLEKILAEKNILSNKERPGRRRNRDLRSLMDGMFYVIKTQCKWRNVPEKYGHWQAVLRIYNLLKKDNLLNKIYDYYFERLKETKIEEKEKIFRKLPM